MERTSLSAPAPNATAVDIFDSSEAPDDNRYVVGSADERSLIARLGSDGTRRWSRKFQNFGDNSVLTSVAPMPDGGAVVTGPSNLGLVKLASDGTSDWRRQLDPGPDRYRLNEVRTIGRDSILAVGIRSSTSIHSDRDSVWLAKLGQDGDRRWHRFYDTEIGRITDVWTRSPTEYLVGVFTHKSLKSRSLDGVLHITDGRLGAFVPYPRCSITDLGSGQEGSYRVSGQIETMGGNTAAESTVLFGERELPGSHSMLEIIEFPTREVTNSITLESAAGLRLAVNFEDAVPIVLEMDATEGTLRKAPLIEGQCERLIKMTPNSVLGVHSDGDLTEVRLI